MRIRRLSADRPRGSPPDLSCGTQRTAPKGTSLRIGAVVAIAATILGWAAPVRAEPIEDFYRGKTLRMLIGYGPAGGYDMYGRIVADFLSRHLPGHPKIVPQNMQGAGSLLAAKYMYNVAPKDGTVLGSLAQTLALDTMTNATVNINIAEMPYVGRVVSNVDTGVALPKAGITSFEDVRAKQYTVGTSGGGSTSVLFPAALNAYGGAKFKLVRGYSGTTEILLAMERGEVDIVGAYGLPGMLVSHPEWIRRGDATILFQAALKRHQLLPNVPTLPELAQSDEGREVLRAAAGTAEIGRSIITTPGVPPERLRALRTAFQAMLKDPDFIAECEKRMLMVDGAPGEDMDAIVHETLRLPHELVDKIGQMMK